MIDLQELSRELYRSHNEEGLSAKQRIIDIRRQARRYGFEYIDVLCFYVGENLQEYFRS